MDRQAGCTPGFDSAGNVGDVGGAEIEERADGEAGGVALVADQDQWCAQIGDGVVGGPRVGVDPRLKDGAVDDQRTGDGPVAASLVGVPDIDEKRNKAMAASTLCGSSVA